MSTLDTAIGPIPAADLEVRRTEQDVEVGRLTSTAYYYEGQLVKLDQNLEVSEAALRAAGFTQL